MRISSANPAVPTSVGAGKSAASPFLPVDQTPLAQAGRRPAFARPGVALLLAATLAGCGNDYSQFRSSGEIIVADNGTSNCVAKGTTSAASGETTPPVFLSSHIVNPEYFKLVMHNPRFIEKILDCTLVDLRGETDGKVTDEVYLSSSPVSSDDSSPSEQANMEQLRILRGHILVNMAASYGYFNLTGSLPPSLRISFKPDDQTPDDAASLLSDIYTAELGLRYASGVKRNSDAVTVGFPAADKASVTPREDYVLQRVAPVMVLAVKAENPSLRRGYSLFKSILGAVNGSAPNALDALKLVDNAILKTVAINVVGSA